MTSTKPYLIRAIYEWIVDNGLTPHLLVDTRDPQVSVPQQYVKENSIVLNLAPSAVRDLQLGNEFIGFSARFAGVSQEVFVPVGAARMIFARENGQGMALTEQPPEAAPSEDAPPPPPPPAPGGGKRGGHLTRVK
ncbi:MAG: ClpXP protease specificity-enhancing factor [Gammaproteobacteria bacterium]|nr:ClpXP protease specificity-enhancing factor [Gammaproteobacteria bacterium]